MDDYETVKITCIECDNVKCKIARKYVPFDSKEGCVRKCTLEQQAQYFHYMNEVLPFIHLYENPERKKEALLEIENFLSNFYYNTKPIKLITKNGKVSQTDF